MAAAIPRASAADAVVVQLADGRSLSGVVDARSDDERLWVRQEAGGVVLATAVAWREVATATLAGGEVSADQMREKLGASATAGPRVESVFNAAGGISLSGRPPVFETTRRRPRVRSVEIVQACLVNLDSDIEPDGLRVSIAAIDETGAAVAVRGNLTARLYGERRPPHFPDIEFALEDDWSMPVAESDFVEGVATYELPFRRTAPEWQFDLLPDALLDVRLGAHESGNFAASAPVMIRAFNPVRDDLQLFRGMRFLPREMRGTPAAGRAERSDALWMHWGW
jgi:hypothetical protein